MWVHAEVRFFSWVWCKGKADGEINSVLPTVPGGAAYGCIMPVFNVFVCHCVFVHGGNGNLKKCENVQAHPLAINFKQLHFKHGGPVDCTVYTGGECKTSQK